MYLKIISDEFLLNLQIGILKELCKQGILTETQTKQTIDKLTNKNNYERNTYNNEEKSSSIL